MNVGTPANNYSEYQSQRVAQEDSEYEEETIIDEISEYDEITISESEYEEFTVESEGGLWEEVPLAQIDETTGIPGAHRYHVNGDYIVPETTNNNIYDSYPPTDSELIEAEPIAESYWVKDAVILDRLPPGYLTPVEVYTPDGKLNYQVLEDVYGIDKATARFAELKGWEFAQPAKGPHGFYDPSFAEANDGYMHPAAIVKEDGNIDLSLVESVHRHPYTGEVRYKLNSEGEAAQDALKAEAAAEAAAEAEAGGTASEGFLMEIFEEGLNVIGWLAEHLPIVGETPPGETPTVPVPFEP
jgi:hypothetical protein